MNLDADAKGGVISRNHDHPGADAKRKQNVKGRAANASPPRFVSEAAIKKASSLIQPHSCSLLTDRTGKTSLIVGGNALGKGSNDAGDG